MGNRCAHRRVDGPSSAQNPPVEFTEGLQRAQEDGETSGAEAPQAHAGIAASESTQRVHEENSASAEEQSFSPSREAAGAALETGSALPSAKPYDYSKWDKLEVEEDEEEDPMKMPVCSEIPWHGMAPLLNKLIDDEYGPEPEPERSMLDPDASKADQKKQETAASEAESCTQSSGSSNQASPSRTREEAEMYKERGTELFKKRKFRDAIGAWSEAERIAFALGDDALWIAARNNVALAELKNQNWAAVEFLTSELLGKDPRNEKALYRRGVAREKQQNLEGARLDFIKICSLNFLNCDAQDALSRVESALRSR